MIRSSSARMMPSSEGRQHQHFHKPRLLVFDSLLVLLLRLVKCLAFVPHRENHAETLKKNGSMETGTGVVLSSARSVWLLKSALRRYVTPLGKLARSGVLLAAKMP